MKPMTDSKYMLNKGNNCPFCNSEDLSWDDISIERSNCFQEVSCESCESTWFDKYVMVGYIQKEY